MKKQGKRWFFGSSGAVIALASAAWVWAQAPAQLPLDPVHTAGQNVTPAYEGWYQLPDGTFNLLVGYYNRNTKESIDIPVGPNNHLDPGGPDLGQPTHFLPGRQWGVFVINVPKDFGATKRVTWTIVANGKPATVPFHLDPVYNVAPFKDATNNTPPFLGWSENGPFLQGPPLKITQTYTATAGEPLTLNIWGGDDNVIPPGVQAGGGGRRGRMPTPFIVNWRKFRGPGEVTFGAARPPVEKGDYQVPKPAVFTGKASTTATFSEPGDYVLEVVGNDISGDGGAGFQCCWTTLQAKITVKPGAGSK